MNFIENFWEFYGNRMSYTKTLCCERLTAWSKPHYLSLEHTFIYIDCCKCIQKGKADRLFFFSHKPDSIISILSSFLYIFLSIQCCWDWLRFHNSVLMVFTSQWHQDYAKIKMAQTMFPSLVDAWQWEYMINFKENCVIDQMRLKQKTKKNICLAQSL